MRPRSPLFSSRKRIGAFIALIAVVLIVVAIVAVPVLTSEFAQQKKANLASTVVAKGTQVQLTPKPHATPTLKPHLPTNGYPHVQGNRIVDANGQPLILRGAQVEEVLNMTVPGPDGHAAIQDFASIVHTMSQWHMNAVRLPTCNTIWQTNPSAYISRLQTAVTEANAAGLYVILDAHDDHRCSPPYNANDVTHLPRLPLESYWQAIATAFKNNPDVIFDVYNEPALLTTNREAYTTADWQLWLNGGQRNGETFIGMQDLVNVIRATGAKQMLMVEGYSYAETFNNIGTNLINDPDVVYEAHDYGLLKTPADLFADYGFMLPRFPIFVGEWALMGGGNSGQTNCSNIVPSQANQVVQAFLQYMAQNHISWTAYSFNSQHMIVDYTKFAPTSFDFNWKCGQTNPTPGMGVIVQSYLSSAAGKLKSKLQG
jgi:Cellulase (glycosyl hydrolase family 5)